ncbi:long-chain-fatty-acid--CoA ligase [Rossellomorea marisflavi]|uniref:long-chain-fatty-acid--CoA ligase n=1 Tax=Rossellomorea marisflavi TaxID=189381 RepID=UPI00203CAADB|nr:long-chain-fatty-acid--CoA ligase [Rossellomorea marisflavi]MCM2589216.1 long-chain-fatty-acid--CoA ligase [Rossellomorea marisflavi]
MYATTGTMFDQSVENYRNQEAIVEVKSGRRMTYGQWQERVHQMCNALQAEGVRKGDTVSTFLYNTELLATVYFACGKIGAIINPINFRLNSDELAFIMHDAEPKVFLFEEALQNVVEGIAPDFGQTVFWYEGGNPPAFSKRVSDMAFSTQFEKVEVDENDPYAMMYTSGTTGRPKGVLHRHRDVMEQALILTGVMGYRSADAGLVTAPMFHCAELHCAFVPRVLAGAKNVILHQFDPKGVLETIEREGITTLFAAPTMWSMMLEEGTSHYNTSSLRNGLYGAAPMAPSLVRKLHDELKIELIQAYGQTEMGPAIAFLLPHEQLIKAGAAGKAAYHHEIRVVKPETTGPAQPEDVCAVGEIGEIIVKGSCTMIGYHGRSEATEHALYKGWYHTGDLGYVDGEGYLYIADRIDDMIISGGENIYPREVEDALHAHEGVGDVAVLGTPDEKWGEVVTAVIVPKSNTLTAQELDDYLKNGKVLAGYKRPRNYRFTPSLPRNASGKIQKFLLKETLSNEIHTK